jgi:hypothetical protein
VNLIDPQVQKLIDQGVITAEQAREAADATPAAGEVTGIARCLNEGCERFGEARPIRMRRETVYHRAPGLPLIESSTTHLCAVDDTDLLCPIEQVEYVDDEGVSQTKTVGCGRPVALQEHEPPVYQKMLVV